MIARYTQTLIISVIIINYVIVFSWLQASRSRNSFGNMLQMCGTTSKPPRDIGLKMTFNERWKSNKKSLQSTRKQVSTRQMDKSTKKLEEIRKLEKENRVQRLDIERVGLSNITIGQKMRGRVISFAE